MQSNHTKEKEWLLREKYNGQESPEFFEDVERLAAGEPLAYVIGHVPFLGATIYLDSKPLIPRPETEFWVSECLKTIPLDSTARVLDLCAGSGCIGVALLLARPHIKVDFVEINDAHHSTIKKNIAENDIKKSRTHIIGGNLYEEIFDAYDYIFCNPPYIDREADTVDASVEAHEPHEALFGGKLGIALIEQILRNTPHYLSYEKGVLYLEHEPTQASFIVDYAKEHDLIAESAKDQYGVLRYTRITRTR